MAKGTKCSGLLRWPMFDMIMFSEFCHGLKFLPTYVATEFLSAKEVKSHARSISFELYK